MVSRLIWPIVYILLSVIGSVSSCSGQKGYSEKQLMVSLRTIGHQILQQAGDSSSRVLPIKKSGISYLIQFESRFALEPDRLISAINDVLKKTEIANAYIVEVEKCSTAEVVYSYEIDRASQLEMIPCRGRQLPKSCYNILLTLKSQKLGSSRSFSSKKQAVTQELNKTYKPLYAFGLLILVVIVVFFFLRRRKKTNVYDSNLILIGQYSFDKRSSCLSIDGQNIELSGKETKLLLLLYKHINETLDRDIILHSVWGDEGNYIGRTLDVFISKLRKKLELDPRVKIVNTRGVGYKLIIDNK